MGDILTKPGGDTALDVPTEEAEDITCAETLQRVLRWHPAASVWIDYAAATPTIHIVERPYLSAASLDPTSDPIESVSLTPRDDLQVPEVVLIYEQVSTINGTQRSTITTDRAPVGATGRAFGGLVMTITLDGGTASTVTQQIAVDSINTASLAWWKKHVPWMADNNYSGFSLDTGSASLVDSDGNTLSIGSWKELTEGGIADWMNAQARNATLSMKVTFKYTNSLTGVVQEDQNRTLKLNLRVTDASITTFTKTLSSEAGEPVPTGLAQGLYDPARRASI